MCERLIFDAGEIGALLECPVCMERYTSSRAPKLLPCSHTVCQTCVSDLLRNNTVKCPMCRWLHNVPCVKQIPCNLTIIGFLDVQPLRPCEECTAPSKRTTCSECNMMLCAACCKQHAERVRGEILSLTSDLGAILPKFRKLKEQVDKLDKEAQENDDRLRVAVHTDIGVLVLELTVRKRELLAGIQKQADERREEYDSLRSFINDKLLTMDDYVKSIDCLTKTANEFTKDDLNCVKEQCRFHTDDVTGLIGGWTVQRYQQRYAAETSDTVDVISKHGDLTVDSDLVTLMVHDGLLEESECDPTQNAVESSMINLKLSNTNECLGDKEPVISQPDSIHHISSVAENIITYDSRATLIDIVKSLPPPKSMTMNGQSDEYESTTSSIEADRAIIAVCPAAPPRVQPAAPSSEHQHETMAVPGKDTIMMRSQPKGVLKNTIAKWVVDGQEYLMDTPQGVAVDPVNGNIIVASYRGNQVHVFSRNYQIINTFGGPGHGRGCIFKPTGVAVNSQRFIIVAELGVNKCQVFRPSGDFVGSLGYANLQTEGRLDSPSGVAVDSNDSIYVVDSIQCCVMVYNSNGTFIRTLGNTIGQFKRPQHIACSKDAVVVSDWGSKRVHILSYDGTNMRYIDNSRQNGALISPADICVYPNGNLAVMDTSDKIVKLFDRNGRIRAKFTLAGYKGEPRDDSFIALTQDGTLIVSDQESNSLQFY